MANFPYDGHVSDVATLGNFGHLRANGGGREPRPFLSWRRLWRRHNMSGCWSRDKGARTERAIVRLLQGSGAGEISGM